ncbi:MAG TPA: tetratricopeptide repeat protein [Xanthomonadaceae bacterium]|nr:tetratricopeptide repeat protein [Xanthomonadaceae bacterium]
MHPKASGLHNPYRRLALRLAMVAAVLLAPAGTVAAAAMAEADDPLAAMLAGEFALQGGDPAAAAAEYLRAAQARRDAELAERAAAVALLAGDSALAERAIAQWEALAGTTVAVRKARVHLAVQLGDRGMATAMAVDLLRGADDDEGWQAVAQILAAQPSSALTAGILEDVLGAGAAPGKPEAYLAFAEVSARGDHDALARRWVEAAAARFADSPRVWLWQARLLREAGEDEAAREAIDRALSHAGDATELRYAAAIELDAMGDARAAAAALAQGPQDETSLFARVAFLARAQDNDALRALYEELSVDVQDSDDVRWFLLGQLAELLERNQEALRWYARVSDPDRRGRAELRTTVLLEKTGKLDEALRRLRTLQVSDSDDGEVLRDAYLLEAELLLQHERMSGALAAYDRGLMIFEDDPGLLYSRALAHERADDIPAAEADLRRMVELDPDNADALNALGYTLADRTERYEEALAYISKAIELKPDSAAIVDSMGWVMYRMGRHQEALEQLRRAYEMEPDPEIAAHYGEVLWQSGEKDKAVRIWREGVELDPDNRALRTTLERFGQ